MIKVSAEHCLPIILEHKELFFNLIDVMDSSGATDEISQSLYVQSCNQLIKTLGEDSTPEGQRVINALSIENLVWNGLLVHVDNHLDTLTFQSFLIDLIRNIDTSRIKSLTKADFDDLRKQFAYQREQFEYMNLSEGLPEYEEACNTLFEKLRLTHSKVKSNVMGLQGCARRLADDIDDLDRSSIGSTLVRRKTLEELAVLYERFVIPCSEFLNPNERLEEGKSFIRELRRIEDIFLSRGEPEIASKIQYRSASIHAFYKSVDQVERNLKRYYRQHKRSREIYNALERAYNRLNDSARSLYTGNLRDKHLPAEHEALVSNNLLLGLKSTMQSMRAKVAWRDYGNLSYLREMQRVYLLSQEKHSNKNLGSKDISLEEMAELRRARQRQEVVFNMVDRLDLKTHKEDVVHFIHESLQSSLEDYQLEDCLTGFRHIMASKALRPRLKPSKNRKQIVFQGYRFDYWARTLLEA